FGEPRGRDGRKGIIAIIEFTADRFLSCAALAMKSAACGRQIMAELRQEGFFPAFPAFGRLALRVGRSLDSSEGIGRAAADQRRLDPGKCKQRPWARPRSPSFASATSSSTASFPFAG